MNIFIVFLFIFSVFPSTGFSRTPPNYLEFGVGLSSSYSGRYVPGLHLAVGYHSIQIAINSSGVKTDVYEHRIQQISGYYQWDNDAYLATIRAAIGFGFARSFRSFQENSAFAADEGIETISGIASKLEILFSDRYFLAIEALNGKGSQSSRLIFKPFAQILLGFSI